MRLTCLTCLTVLKKDMGAAEKSGEKAHELKNSLLFSYPGDSPFGLC